MFMSKSRYHSLLKVSALVVTLVLLFDGGFVHPVTKQLSDNTVWYLASVGTNLTAKIEPTELNSITAELAKREQDLNVRELELNEREISSRNFGATQNVDYSIYILSVILFILTALISLNYAMDWSRITKIRHERKVA